ncbi:MAG TPA: AAA family ATPase [Acidobacteriota bacterium]|nr:AAA family ATPase [Acidobacteriota bacterium]
MSHRVVVTGGPGAGKTALLTALEARGYPYVPETARAVIQERLRRGLSPRPAPEEFAREILRVDLERYRDAPPDGGWCFFDRGILDALGMLDQLGLLTAAETDEYVRRYPYVPTVFMLPPWREIYRMDEERDQTFEESVRVHDELTRWYLRCGYALAEVPRASVADRCGFVLNELVRRAWNP